MLFLWFNWLFLILVLGLLLVILSSKLLLKVWVVMVIWLLFFILDMVCFIVFLIMGCKIMLGINVLL